MSDFISLVSCDDGGMNRIVQRVGMVKRASSLLREGGLYSVHSQGSSLPRWGDGEGWFVVTFPMHKQKQAHGKVMQDQ